MSSEPDNLVLQLLRDMHEDMADMRFELKGGITGLRAELKADIHSLRADIASDLLAMDAWQAAEHKQTREQIVGLRQAVVEHHTSVVGHGILISARLRRVEQPLDLPPLDAH